MARSTVHYADNKTNNILKALHNKLRPAGTPVQRVEYIIELLLLRIFEVRVKRDEEFKSLRKLFGNNDNALVFSDLLSLTGNQALETMNKTVFPFYGSILGKARTVYANKNLPQKVQDQLVLIEEVFSNSSFSNNVKNGNLNEILGLVSDIDEERLLQTDLLGDAIESALSEQGGTKDVGLYRTPDHVRQMMVAMVDPDFKDTIFDPACGTGGFLFDAFQYVLEKAGKDENWPGKRSHKEIKDYFKKYFSKTESTMPSNSMANTFYRVGISGIEYLGMIRKMAAINLYIRGLNPANIEQGDSLDLYNPNVEANDKSVVIANPPFGAKLDQPAYPNVWEEYPKTDSTTLFVKLMFNHLKTGGKCAVVVSEGFLTWDNEAAREMRKLLLEEANLKAIISLPQGVFVSKNGQGAKTSILYFEKGGPTKHVWFYKITNDGYSMGVNRKEISGCQVPDVLELFTKYVKHEKIPPKTKNSFTISTEWIKQIDPRLKERIKNEVTEQQKEKFSEKRKIEIEKLEDKLKKRAIDKKEYDEKVSQLDNAIENNIQNEIAKRIERAHACSFNLQNHRSSLTDSQIEKWRGAFSGIKVKNGENIELRYQSLYKAGNGEALQILASFNPESALEMDIAREYLSKLENKNKKMLALEGILIEAQKYPKAPLRELLNDLSESRKFVVDEEKIYFEPTISTKTNTISISNETLGKNLKVKKRILLQKGDLVVGLLHTQNGSFAICDQEYVSTGTFVPLEINKTEINPDYLFYNLATAFSVLGAEDATGRENYKVDDILSLQIPLPPLEAQEEIVEKIRRQKEIIEGANKIIENKINSNDLFDNEDLDKIPFGKIISESKLGVAISKQDLLNTGDKGIAYIKMQNIVGGKIKNNNIATAKTDQSYNKYLLKTGDILFNTRNSFDLVGKMAIYKGNPSPAIYNHMLLRIRLKDGVLPEYVNAYFLTDKINQQLNQIKKGSTSISAIYEGDLRKLSLSIPNLESQKRIVEKLNREAGVLEQIYEFKNLAEDKINKILEELWGNKEQ